MAASSPSSSPPRNLATNRRVRRDYEILESLETGIELRGTEVKSVRDGKVSLNESFASVEGRQVFAQNLRIEPYTHGNQFNHDPLRPKRLLLHRAEITRLGSHVAEKGLTLVPLRLYLKRGKVKLELGLARGKHQHDKREDLKRRTADREADRAIRGLE
jgi:SsrA-binding protein